MRSVLIIVASLIGFGSISCSDASARSPGVLFHAMAMGPTETGGRSWVQQTSFPCVNPTHTVTSVGTSVTATCPASQLNLRRFITFCNSVENTGTPRIKIRIDGTAPVIGATAVGDVLTVGDCVSYNSQATPQCIADTAATALIALQCQ